VWTASTYDTITPNDKLREKHLHSRFHSSIKNGIVSDTCSSGLLSKVKSRASHNQQAVFSAPQQQSSRYLIGHQKRESQLEAAAVEATQEPFRTSNSRRYQLERFPRCFANTACFYSTLSMWNAARATPTETRKVKINHQLATNSSSFADILSNTAGCMSSSSLLYSLPAPKAGPGLPLMPSFSMA